MKIIIAGAGAVGTHLAKLFSREHHAITIIDAQKQKFAELTSNYDLMGIAAAPTSIQALKTAGASNADLVIGVTPDETANLTFCMIASKMGARKTVARVNSDEYLNPANAEIFRQMGIDSLILPEMIAAQEIVNNIQRSWIRSWWEVQNGALILMGIKVRDNCQILHQPLKKLCGLDSPYHVVAIKRGSETIIPHGDDTLEPLDLVYFMTTKRYISYMCEITGKQDYPDVKNVTIMGGGLTSVYISRLAPDYMNIKLIEKDLDRCHQLTEEINNPKVMVINGDGRNISLLDDEDIRNTEAFIALTSNSEINILGCLAAKRRNILKTVALLDKLDFVGMAESLDIGSLVNKQTIAANYIYRMMLKADVKNVKSLVVANADVAEFSVKAGSKIACKPIRELHLPKGCTLGGLVRNGQGQLINGNTLLQEGDHVVAFCHNADLHKLCSFFA